MGKGASHVDWAISMGIFLVYIMLTLIFIKPASQPEYSGNTLLDTIHSGLKNDASYTIKKGYLIIKPTNDIVETKEYVLRIRCLDKYGSCLSASGMNMDWVESEKYRVEKGQHLTLVNESLKDVSCQNMSAVPFDFEDESTTFMNWHVLEMKTKLKKGEENVFWFLYSEDFNYSSHLKVTTGSSSAPCQANPNGWTDCECVKRDLNGNKVNDCLLDDEAGAPKDWTNFTYQFGIAESFSAISKEKLDALKQEYDNQYEALKGNWSFPKDKNFRITIERII